MIYTGGVQFFRTKKRSKMPFLAVFGHFWPFWAIFDRFKLQQMKCLHNREKTSKKKKKKNRIFYRFLAVFGHFGGFWPFLDIFWPFLNSRVSEIMSYTCLPWPTTWATLHSARIMQKCAQNVQKCAQTSFFGPILAKKRIFDPRQNFFLLFSFQKWIPLEKLDIKHVLYDFLHATTIMK